jgi:hypothetical protein
MMAMKTDKKSIAIPEILAYTKYYEHDGLLRTYANRAMYSAMLFGVIALAHSVSPSTSAFSRQRSFEWIKMVKQPLWGHDREQARWRAWLPYSRQRLRPPPIQRRPPISRAEPFSADSCSTTSPIRLTR